jgi:hypothetical protein
MIGSLEQSNTFVFIKQMLHPVLLIEEGAVKLPPPGFPNRSLNDFSSFVKNKELIDLKAIVLVQVP